MTQKIDIAILGATGVVGETLLEILAQRKFPVRNIYPLASYRSVGNTVTYKNKELLVEDANTFDFSKVQLCFSAVSADVAKKIVPKATEAGCVVIDKSSQYRYEPDVPLVVPEVNESMIAEVHNRKIIAVPNCSTIQMVVALKPIYDAVGIDRINIATYQSVSGSGKEGIEELSQQVAEMLNGRQAVCQLYPKPIAFNVLPHCDDFLENGYTKEEMKLVTETQKIFNDYAIQVNPTAVRVPVFFGHAEAIHIETTQKISAAAVREILENTPGITVIDELKPEGYPTPLDLSQEKDAVLVGRIREDISHPQGINLWVVADNVRKGAALNAIQVAEILVRDYL